MKKKASVLQITLLNTSMLCLSALPSFATPAVPPISQFVLSGMENTNSAKILAKSSSTRKIVEGQYVTNNYEQTIRIKGRRYQYSDENGINQWKPLSGSGFAHIRRGVFFYEKDYWCLSASKPKNPNYFYSCTASGWKRENKN